MTAALRIGMFSASLPEPHRKPGGVDVLVHRLAGRLVERGHGVRMYSYSPKPTGALYDHVRLAPHAFAASRAARIVLVPLKLNALDTLGLDVLHLHGDDWFYVRRRLPTLRTFYGSALDEARTATRLRRRLSQTAVFALELLAARLATAGYSLIPGRERRYRVRGALGCGVDLRSAPSSDRSAEPMILFVGTWSGRKRGALLARVFADDVRAQHPTARLVMVSDRAEPGPGVEWIDRPSDEVLDALYAEAWLMCLPSAYEGLGIPYLEALAHGTPVVATPNPGAEYLLSRGGGVIAEPAALGATLNVLLADAERRRVLGAQAVSRAAEFGWDTVCDHYEHAYEAAIESHASTARGRHLLGVR